MAADATDTHFSDVSLGQLVFQSVSRGTHGLSTGVGDFLIDAMLEETLDGASNVDIEILDRDYEGLKSGLFGTRVLVTIDGREYRLTEVRLLGEDHLGGLFENRLISEMREHKGFKKAVRGHVTRAEFIHSLLKELRLPYHFVCPELHRKQKEAAAPEQIEESNMPVASGTEEEEEGSGTAVAPLARTIGPGNPIKGLTVKHQAMNSAQEHVVAEGMRAAIETGAPELAQIAYVVALIQEANMENPHSGDRDSVGSLQVRESTASGIQKIDGHGTLDPMDVYEVAVHFFVAGYWGRGGANALAKKYPTQSPGWIAQQVQGSGYPHAYAPWEAEAKKIVKAFGSTGINVTPTGDTTTRTAQYEFTRGKPGEAEDTFTCCTRLAQEVGWHFFVLGKSIFFVNDTDLLKAPPRYELTPDSPGFVNLVGDVEVGGRKVKIKGRRQPKPSEATLTVRVDRYRAPPGSIISLTGWGPFDGKWVVVSVKRSVFDANCEIDIRAPEKPLPEPQATSSTEEHEDKTGGGGTGGVAGGGLPAQAGYPLARRGKIIGTPHSGTHTLGDWASDNAVDIAVPKGTAVYAVADGRIGDQIGSLGRGGQFAGLRLHLVTNGNEYYYAHLSKLECYAKERVKQGQLLGYSGEANGVQHLHFACMNGSPFTVTGH